MSRRIERLLVAFLAATVFGFAAMVWHLMMVRFSLGDDFAPYSTFRSDPLGAKALFTALESQPAIRTRRLLTDISSIGSGSGATLYFLGADTSPDYQKDIETLNAFAASGGRVVVAFVEQEEREPEVEDGETQEPQEKKKVNTSPDRTSGLVMISTMWGFDYKYCSPEETVCFQGKVQLCDSKAFPQLPADLTWHSTLYFSELSREWKTVYGWRNDGGDLRSVILERPWGRGTIVVCSDSYLLSNEAMQKDRQPVLLAWTAGASKELIFDETHLGTSHSPGIMSLILGHRLHGVLVTLLAVALLFAWKNASSFLPRQRIEEADTPLLQAGPGPLPNLLRRHIRPSDLLEACVDEWQKSQPALCVRSAREARAPDVSEVAKRSSSVALIPALYAEICDMLSERKSSRDRP